MAFGGSPCGDRSCKFLRFRAASPIGVQMRSLYSPDALNNWSHRLEYHDDPRGRRTGSTQYFGIALTWQHWFSPQIEMRPETQSGPLFITASTCCPWGIVSHRSWRAKISDPARIGVARNSIWPKNRAEASKNIVHIGQHVGKTKALITNTLQLRWPPRLVRTL
jgi:hypothetical protein